jgi:hypothetical protein
MYCPQCSQQQVVDEMRFCSRCGFALTGVRELVAGGGQIIQPEVQPQKASPGLRGARQASWIMLGCLPVLLFVAILSALDDDFAVLLLLPMLCLVIAIVRLLYGVFFQERKSRQKKEVLEALPPQLNVGRIPELPPSRDDMVGSFVPREKKTAEVVQPPSVTENTTRLLDE